MTERADWLPEMIRLSDYDGDWKRYVDAVSAVFYRDFIESQPKFQGKWVRCRRDPTFEGKEAGFWHCASEGPNEATRTPSIERCERIGWIRSVISNSDDSRVDHWTNRRHKKTRHLLWLDEEFLVVLEERSRKRDGFQYMQLITAYCTPEEPRKRKLRKERDEARNG